jgi:hypothetical protein
VKTVVEVVYGFLIGMGIVAMFVFAEAKGEGICDFPVPNESNPTFVGTGISRAEYDDVLNRIENVYGNVVARQGGYLNIERLWTDPTPNAQAWRDGNIWNVDMFGGLARTSGMTKWAYGLVGCHELGHHLGGQPKQDWASVEGMTKRHDYWATYDCMARLGVDSDVPGGVLATILARFSGERRPNPNTPDMHKVSRTISTHPPAQCRLDTYRAGKRKACRPRCWKAGAC